MQSCLYNIAVDLFTLCFLPPTYLSVYACLSILLRTCLTSDGFVKLIFGDQNLLFYDFGWTICRVPHRANKWISVAQLH